MRKRSQRIDLIGQRFGRLIVLEFVESKFTVGGCLWLCECECGNRLIRRTGSLRDSVNNTSCRQCLTKTRSNNCHLKTHGLCRLGQTRLYKVWKSMRQRCTNKNNPVFKNYGSKGILICPEWLSYPKFKEWAESHQYSNDGLPRHKSTLTIDRIDPDGNYEPSNCRFIPLFENSRRRHKVVV